jgi:hypothetical protein
MPKNLAKVFLRNIKQLAIISMVYLNQQRCCGENGEFLLDMAVHDEYKVSALMMAIFEISE